MASKMNARRPKKAQLLLAVSSVMIIAGGLIAFFCQAQLKSKAEDVLVTGGPSLSAAAVNHIFAQLGSPMAGTGAIVEQESRNTNIDDAFALGVWWAETNDGAAGVGSSNRNPGSVRGATGYPVSYDGYTIYPSYGASIRDWFRLLKNSYILGRGTNTVYSISVPYVGTAGAGNWAYKVTNLMVRYRYQAPPRVIQTPIAQATVSTPRAAQIPIAQATVSISKAVQTPIAQATVSTPRPTPAVRAYIPIGNEDTWKRHIIEKRRQILTNRDETSAPTAKPAVQPAAQISVPASAINPNRQLLFGVLGCTLLALAILILYSIRIRRRRKSATIVGSTATVQPQVQTHTAPRFTTTEELAIVPPTPMLAGSRGMPLTPFIASHREEQAIVQVGSGTGATNPFQSSHPIRISAGATDKIQSVPVRESNTEKLTLIPANQQPNRQTEGLISRFGKNTQNS